MSNERYIRIFYYLCNALGDNAGARDFTNIFINPVSPGCEEYAKSLHISYFSAYSAYQRVQRQHSRQHRGKPHSEKFVFLNERT